VETKLKQNMKKLIFILPAILFFLASCEKEQQDEVINVDPYNHFEVRTVTQRISGSTNVNSLTPDSFIVMSTVILKDLTLSGQYTTVNVDYRFEMGQRFNGDCVNGFVDSRYYAMPINETIEIYRAATCDDGITTSDYMTSVGN
jgi:hypothetical protein